MPDKEQVKRTGEQAVGAVRRGMARGIARLLSRDPDRLATAVEMGLVSRAWIDDPGGEKLLAATPVEVVERFLEREVERRPSTLSQIGLSTIQILAWRGDGDGDDSGDRVAIAFTDLVGFTAYTNEHGDDVALALLADHYRTCGPIVRSRGGRVVKRLGDGLMLVFPEPEAAVLACLELAGAPPEPLQLRAGIHVGNALVSHADVLGHAVNVAARVADEAPPGAVLVTEDVLAAVEALPGVELGRAHRRRFKGLSEPVSVAAARFADR